MSKIYLDYNATAPLRACARAALLSAHDKPLNASAVHGFGREGRRLIEDARSALSKVLGAGEQASLVFNSGATEGNNTVLCHFAQAYPEDRILISGTEHPSVDEVLGDKAARIPVDGQGCVDLAALAALLKDGPRVSIVSVMLANNETGVIQPIKDIAKLVHNHGAFLHCDATQGLGRTRLDMASWGVDFMTVSGHKCGGPQGVGALVIGLCGVSPVLLLGGGQEKRLRAGTENVAGICAFAAAAVEADQELEAETQRLLGLREQIEAGVRTAAPEAVIFGDQADRLPNTVLFAVAGLKAETLVMNFDLEGIALSNGSACSSGTVKQSHVLKAMHVAEDLGAAALRVSMGHDTQQSDVDGFLAAWAKIYKRMAG